MLRIHQLHACIGEQEILKGISLTINPGEVHAIMGPNGSGKSTLSKVIAGHPDYQITAGDIEYNGKSLTALSVEERAQLGLFLAFQYPVEIPGVSNISFLKAAVNTVRQAQQKPAYDAMDFLNLVRSKLAAVNMDEGLLYRAVNEGFSGGEKKRNEILQMLLLEPSFALLDETDSGLDIDALQTVSAGVNSLRHAERSFLLITHYQRLLDYIKPDFVHVLAHGKIIKTGGAELALELESKGYGWVKELEQQVAEGE